MDGIEAIVSIYKQVPSARVVIFTACQGEEDIYRALRAGAHGYLPKDTALNEVVECIRAVAEGARWIPPSVASRLSKRVGGKA
jgi:DNA-binding NarL/FixJ family response regulator